MAIDIDKTIQYTLDVSNKNPYWSAQINFNGDAKDHIKFHRKLIELSHKFFLDELYSISRKKTDKSVDEIFSFLENSNFVFSGIKTVYKPIGSFHEWDRWENGYIEGFCRFSGENKPDYFIWTYIHTDHLRDILEEFKENLNANLTL